MRYSLRAAAMVALSSSLVLTTHTAAVACGCFSPPLPSGVTDFAVNQQAEQIIFEVLGDTTVAAHVMIRYAGAPEAFAWVVPIPSVPDLALSESMPFALLDAATRPDVDVSVTSACPSPQYYCDYHDECWRADGAEAPSDAGSGGGEAGSGVHVFKQEIIGSYDTVVFGADEAGAAVEWLLANDFIVNDSMTPYMQPYLDAGMLFVAAKLVPGAGVEEIKPLKMTYEHAGPIIPLQLTAVAAEPHLAVTSWIFADAMFAPRDQPLAQIDGTRITMDQSGRVNYPMVLSRTVDEAGGDAFVAEYAGPSSGFVFNDDDPGGCCQDDWDSCFAGYDGVCQCPGQEWDADDCASIEGLEDGLAFLDELGSRFTTLTRLTTRVSPEEMTFDPVFEPALGVNLSGRLYLSGTRTTLSACEDRIVDQADWNDKRLRVDCASIYCGAGECVGTSTGAGCVCDAGHVVRRFTDLDGEESITCVPDVGTVDLGLGLDFELPDACAGQTVQGGECWEVGGFPASDCGDKAGVLNSSGELASCVDVAVTTGGPGAEDFSKALKDVDVCWPTHPTCGQGGWLTANNYIYAQGVDCGQPAPDPNRMMAPPGPDCDDDGEPDYYVDNQGNETDTPPGSGGGGSGTTTDGGGNGCAAGGSPAPLAWLGLLGLLALVRRQRHERA